MTSSGTYSFNLQNGSIVLSAFERIQLRAPSLRQEHMQSAYRELNLLLATIANLGPNMWEVLRTQTTLTAGTATYSINAKTIMITDATVVTNIGSSNEQRIYITPLSRTEYMSLTNQNVQGFPTTYWFDRLISPTITLWPVPDSGGPYTLDYLTYTQMQDANLTGGETPDVPYRWLDVLVSGLAHRLSRIYAPELEQIRKADAQEAWQIAASQDTEGTGFMLAPALGLYYR